MKSLRKLLSSTLGRSYLAHLLASLLFCYPASAAELEPYIGGEIGAAYWDYDFLDDDVALALSGFVGLDISDYAGIELGYQNFGTMNYVAGSTEGELEAESFSAAAVITIAINSRIQPFILGGSERLRYDEQTQDTTVFNTDSKNESFFGIGVYLPQDADNRSAIRISLSSHDGGDILRLAVGGKLRVRQ